jgi:hypothetical protein
MSLKTTAFNAQIEARVLGVIERVVARQPIEDSFVECKAVWIEASKAARRLAGHANAARGEPILWLVGVDEKAGQIPGADLKDLAQWWAQVVAVFDGPSPSLRELCVPYDGVTVVALYMETDRAPFVLKNASGGQVTHEVPWREGTSVRTAHRADLIRLLVATTRVPECEILGVALKAIRNSDRLALVTLEVALYLVPQANDRICIPFHRCDVRFRTGDRAWILPESIRLQPQFEVDGEGRSIELSHTIRATETEVLVDGPGCVYLRANFESAWPGDVVLGLESNLGADEVLDLEAKLGLVNGSYPIVLDASLCPVPGSGVDLLRWEPNGRGQPSMGAEKTSQTSESDADSQHVDATADIEEQVPPPR